MIVDWAANVDAPRHHPRLVENLVQGASTCTRSYTIMIDCKYNHERKEQEHQLGLVVWEAARLDSLASMRTCRRASWACRPKLSSPAQQERHVCL